MQNVQEKTLEKKASNFKASDLLASDTTGRRTWQNVNSREDCKEFKI